MNDQTTEKPKGWLERLSDALIREPQSREQLLQILHEAEDRHLIDPESLSMIESTLQLSEMRVRDILIPRAQMIYVKNTEDFKTYVETAKSSGHSRFPVFDDDEENVVGILLAKDLLGHAFEDEILTQSINVRDLIRPAIFVPESKRLDSLLREFRVTHNHIAIVIDEFGNVSGLVTIEDVLEQIVGDIEDEHDVDEDEDNIKKHADGHYTVKAHTSIEDFNEYFNTNFSDNEFDTIGGLVLQKFGYLPKRGEMVTIDRCRFTVLLSDRRRLKLLELWVV
ncbi:MAG: HlyC/CorC family transporter [Gammaproteobacteria bacterium]